MESDAHAECGTETCHLSIISYYHYEIDAAPHYPILSHLGIAYR